MNKDWKKTRTIYWSDERHDDFDQVGLERPQVPKGYNYIRSNHFKNFFMNILYFGIAVPLIGLAMFFKGVRFKHKHLLSVLKNKGAFIYSNHVSLSDVTKFQTLCFPFKRVNILGYSDSLSMKFVSKICVALGYLPLPLKGDFDNMKSLVKAFDYYINNKKQHVLIYPEAHIWPYYTHVRNFSAGSFYYPAYCNAPVVPSITLWRKPFIGKKPRQTVVFGKPIFPKKEYSMLQNKMYLYEECKKAMKELEETYPQYEYIKYIKVEKDDPTIEDNKKTENIDGGEKE